MSERTVQTTATPDVSTFQILSEGQEVPRSYHVVSINISGEINKIPKATIIFLDGEAAKQTFAISDTDSLIPGKNIEIKAGYQGKDDSVFKGVIIKHGIKVKRNSTFLVIECRDKAVGMTIQKKNRYFSEMKDSELMEDLIGAHGLEKQVETTGTKHESLVQYETTDWDFLLSRAKENGLFTLIENGKISVKKPDFSDDSTVKLVFGSSVLELDAEIDARLQPSAYKASSWDFSEQSLKEVEAAEPGFSLNGNLTAKNLSEVINKPAYFQSSTRIPEPALQAMADAELLKKRLAKIMGRAKCQGSPQLRPGKIVEIGGIGNRFKGKAFISGVRHQIANGNWETDIQLGFPEEIFQNNDNKSVSINGLHVGIVTQLQEDPSGEHRIKVRLPIISTSEEGIWARVASLDAGKNRGMFFRPEIDDEVVVGFLNNDPNHSIVLGMCHSSAKPAPIEAKDENHEKGYVSRSEMKILFDDDKKILTIRTPSNNQVIFSEEEKGIFFEDQNGNKLKMTEDGIFLESPKNIELKATKDLKTDSMKADIKTSAGFKADGGGGCELSAGGGNTMVKGGMVMIN
ncbi:Rhs element Vgr protein [Pseudarcicella hirudinis]|uniref:Rhs element Vgr protein n=1 Tax=Pseudarcicella hirudinis TaxID=1079859 RepID=A0A1I5N537_9BACT|nr:type VI secretion system tip protein VgrG [Pseudarcicella hirudinis]SFP16928.1 Rhs element Vgr protein [Pseudarcicella hirudinis]